VHNPQELVERYVAVWHEPDATKRRAAIETLWTPDGAHYSPTLEAHGYDELAARVQRSFDRWVAGEGMIFRSTGDMREHHGAITFGWEMVGPTGEVESVGRDVLLLAPDDHVQTVYQFIIS
jgi:hypothetical protein